MRACAPRRGARSSRRSSRWREAPDASGARGRLQLSASERPPRVRGAFRVTALATASATRLTLVSMRSMRREASSRRARLHPPRATRGTRGGARLARGGAGVSRCPPAAAFADAMRCLRSAPSRPHRRRRSPRRWQRRVRSARGGALVGVRTAGRRAPGAASKASLAAPLAARPAPRGEVRPGELSAPPRAWRRARPRRAQAPALSSLSLSLPLLAPPCHAAASLPTAPRHRCRRRWRGGDPRCRAGALPRRCAARPHRPWRPRPRGPRCPRRCRPAVREGETRDARQSPGCAWAQVAAAWLTAAARPAQPSPPRGSPAAAGPPLQGRRPRALAACGAPPPPRPHPPAPAARRPTCGDALPRRNARARARARNRTDGTANDPHSKTAPHRTAPHRAAARRRGPRAGRAPHGGAYGPQSGARRAECWALCHRSVGGGRAAPGGRARPPPPGSPLRPSARSARAGAARARARASRNATCEAGGAARLGPGAPDRRMAGSDRAAGRDSGRRGGGGRGEGGGKGGREGWGVALPRRPPRRAGGVIRQHGGESDRGPGVAARAGHGAGAGDLR